MPKRIDSRRIDLTNKVFGELTVIKLSDKRGAGNTLLWECQCSCNEIVYLQGYSLINGYYKSCGCRQAEKRDVGVKRHIERDRIDGTRKSALKSKLHSGNKSGHKGVMWLESRKKWKAYIGFKGKQISLGYFANLEDAVGARREAEEKYHKPYLEGKDNGSKTDKKVDG